MTSWCTSPSRWRTCRLEPSRVRLAPVRVSAGRTRVRVIVIEDDRELTMSFSGVRMLTLVLSASLSLAASAADLSRARKIGERCWQDVRVLAHDDMEGRRPGSAGHRRAAQFVAEQLRKAKLVPASDTGFLQPVSLESR